LNQLAELVPAAREAVEQADADRLGMLINRNYDLRRSICTIPAGQAEMVIQARNAGASAKFAGSGGAIIGTYTDPAVFPRLDAAMTALGCQLIQPRFDSAAPRSG
jgi:glucuronokinase